MKVRAGFVSNSSTSSFLMYGIFIEDEEATLELLKQNKMADEDTPSLSEWVWNEGEKILKEKGLEADYPYDGEGPAIGRSWDEVQDDQTGKEFKDAVQVEMVSLFGPDIECHTMKEAWGDY